MHRQPSFGQRLRQLRTERGLSQAALAGDGLSTGYLSRLESGARQPNDRVVAYLAERLGIGAEDFAVCADETSLAHALTLAVSAESDQAVMALRDLLATDSRHERTPRWQALWMIARIERADGNRAAERVHLRELVELADELGLPQLRVRSRARLARCLRAEGEIGEAMDVAVLACSVAREADLAVGDLGMALLALVTVEAEAGRLPDARAHAEELCALTKGETGPLAVEALWAAATVRFRQGDHVPARELLEEALEAMDSRVDVKLWMRLRLAAASLYLQLTPPCVPQARSRLAEAETALELVGTSLHRQEATTLRAQLAFHEKRYEEARALLDGLEGVDLRLTFRDQLRLSVLCSRLLVQEGRLEEGLRRLRESAQQAQESSNVDLAAEIWRTVAETLAEGRPVPESAG
ncbi:helix-turn-helix domain-containing protein [Streptomyces durbertensis]|uniref:Helix-turn-helix domain-containing protein n=1 Tax=Streptomyces durbertensis TaxID=2448886 RepID=A0ABR6ENE2_9ACTN|nr:helix-turn-helix domain-containing protein [Streptomyces durbertensis]MBB1246865.1 helix-turn-helix domain-containing protein [Streptomyces durbertensis]